LGIPVVCISLLHYAVASFLFLSSPLRERAAIPIYAANPCLMLTSGGQGPGSRRLLLGTVLLHRTFLVALGAVLVASAIPALAQSRTDPSGIELSKLTPGAAGTSPELNAAEPPQRDGIWGVRFFVLPQLTIDADYRYMLNLRNSTERSGFVINLGIVSWPF
jgi:hypothetical protein